MRPIRYLGALGALAAVAALAGGCGGDDGGGGASDRTAPSDAGGTSSSTPRTAPPTTDEYRPEIDPAAFVDTVDNRYLPLQPGTTRIYEGESEGEVERIVVKVTDRTKEILGVRCTVVRDTVSIGGEVVEDTFDWFAQDRDGNVWYFGEASRDIEHGEVVSTKGSWEAGVDGAQPGIVMPGDPQVGDAYRQEYYAGEAEDMGEIIRLGEDLRVAAGDYADVLVTRDWTPLEPDVVEHKYYAPGVGVVMEEAVEGGDEHAELVEVRGA